MTRKRTYLPGGRKHGLTVRFTADELADIERAAVEANLTPTGYAGLAAVLCARRLPGGGDPGALRDAGAQLLQARTDLACVGHNLNQAVARFHTIGVPPPELVAATDAAHRGIDDVDEATKKLVVEIQRHSRGSLRTTA